MDEINQLRGLRQTMHHLARLGRRGALERQLSGGYTALKEP